MELRDEKFAKEELEDVYNPRVYWDPLRKKQIDEKRQLLHYLYEQIKKDIDLDIYYVPPKETESDDVFSLFHPNMNVKLSEALEGNCDVEGF